MLAAILNGDILKGKIYDAKTAEPILSVAVTITEMNWISYTNSEGRFTINDMEPGVYTLKISRIGYGEFYTTITYPDCGELLIGIERRTHKIAGYSVSGYKVKERETPVTFTNIDSDKLNESNFGQDLPMLLNDLTNVYSYSDAGNGYGYSYLKVRGFDQKRVGVMVNGIPLNDPEDHQVYWVDLPDLAESVEEIQFQRGVGSTLYGVSAFGGSLNLNTSNLKQDNNLEAVASFGSYNTNKVSIKAAIVLSAKYRMNIRFSYIQSDGYRENTASKMGSYYAGLARIGDRSVTELNLYGGKELVHAGWYASWEGDLQDNHQHNPIEYKDEIDDFFQPHFELHHSYILNENMDIKNSLFYIRGDGFYEQFKDDRDLWEYGLTDIPETIESDLVRKKKVIKDQYGWIGQLRYKHILGELIFGNYISLFSSDHRGEVKELKDVPSDDLEEGFEYYRYEGNKKNVTLYANEIFKPAKDLSVMLNLHFQHMDVEFDQREAGNFTGEYLNSYEVIYNFFNPRFGINYNINKEMNVYANISRSHREPTDNELYDTWDGPDDLGVAPLFAKADTIFNSNGDILRIEWEDPYVKREKLTDYEFGFGFTNSVIQTKINTYWMTFQDEIVSYGGVDDDGSPIRGNAEATIHRGLELSSRIILSDNLEFDGNFSYNDIYFEEFKQFDWDENWDPITINYSGNKIAGFPDIISSAKFVYSTGSWKINSQWQYIGKQYLDNTENEDRIIDVYDLWNAGIEYRINNLLGVANIIMNFRVNNVFDREYETAGYYNAWDEPETPAGNYYWPGAGRNFMTSIRIIF